MKLSDWAKTQGITYQTAWNWVKQNKMPVSFKQTETGTIIVSPEKKINLETYIYCRVSSPNKKDDLERQVNRCHEFCASNNYIVKNTFKEIASGMNDKRPKLIKLISGGPKRIIVENKDRLTRFGFNYIEHLLTQLGYEFIIINRDFENKNDLMQDLISIITSFCCRYYGLRRGRQKSMSLRKQIENE